MAIKIFETIEGVLKGITYFCMLVMAAVAAIFALYFVGMTGIRLAQLLWDLIFAHRWSF